MRLVMIVTVFICGTMTIGYSAPKHRRDSEALSNRDKEFAEGLSLRHRKIFCGQFSQIQRDETIKYARGLGQDKCCTPDEAVLKVMEETGMSLALKGRPDSKKEGE